MSRRVGSVLLSLIAVALSAGSAWAQQTGTITGRVTTAFGQPLGDARVQVVGTTRGGSTG